MRRHGSAGTAAIAMALLVGLAACGGGKSPATTPSASKSTTGTISLTVPAEGATVDRSFTVKGLGSAFEGTLLWTLAGGGAASGTQSVSGYTAAGVTAPKPFQFTVDAPTAGSYTLTVYRESASDGAKTDAVSRTITIR
jgi:hypothetical protein